MRPSTAIGRTIKRTIDRMINRTIGRSIGRMTGKERHRLQRGAVFVPGSLTPHLLSWRHLQSKALRPFIGLRVLLALLASLTLLLAFATVVRGGVRDGEVNRAAAVLRAGATSRCQAQHSRLLRDACLARLDSAALPAPYAKP